MSRDESKWHDDGHGNVGRTWEDTTSGMTPEQKVLAAFEWAAGMAHQGENSGSAWDRAMQETLPTLRAMVAKGTPSVP